MRSENEVRDRIREVFQEELNRRFQDAAARFPERCKYNHRQPLDVQKQGVDGGSNPMYNRIEGTTKTIGLCLYGSEDPEVWGGTICEDQIDAERCPYFTPIVSQEQIVSQFKQDITSIEWVQEHMPHAYNLLWVIGQIELQVPWWRRIWHWVTGRAKKDPVDIGKLLSSGDKV